jgi:hypothetical protein
MKNRIILCCVGLVAVVLAGLVWRNVTSKPVSSRSAAESSVFKDPSSDVAKSEQVSVDMRLRGESAGEFVQQCLDSLPASAYPSFVTTPAKEALEQAMNGVCRAYTSGSLSEMYESLSSLHAPLPIAAGDERMMRKSAEVNGRFWNSLSIDMTREVSVVQSLRQGQVIDIGQPGTNSIVSHRTTGMACHEDPKDKQNGVGVRVPIWYIDSEGDETQAVLTILLQWNVTQSRWEQVGKRIDGGRSNRMAPGLPG